MAAKLVGDTMTSRMLFCVLFILWMSFGTLAYWAWWPINPAIVVISESAMPWEKEVVSGASMSRELTFHITQKVELTVHRRLVEQNCIKCRIFELESSVKSYEPGKYTQSRTIVVPAIVPRGTYRYEAEASWRASPLRQGYTVLPNHIIKVTDPPAKPGISMGRLRLA